ncbi:hypothetical protein D0C16_21160 [Cellvibrio sp. KY-GH-1]|uniref:hypothetical protein n=1 Tax=Cellvibrio sp. KY-GH-1 TaxID=2303332 RepID=UPI001245F730|nr:hypothetical protein [Cellvibrio sp. KY-GH-1]QEY18274.1 hypothetical protein D0C16_21160 [Cellvibrio sp. KY-GH-1]
MADYASKSTAAESHSAAPQARAARTDSPVNSIVNEPVQAEQVEGVEGESELIQTKMDLGVGAERAGTGFDSRTQSIAQTARRLGSYAQQIYSIIQHVGHCCPTHTNANVRLWS